MIFVTVFTVYYILSATNNLHKSKKLQIYMYFILTNFGVCKKNNRINMYHVLCVIHTSNMCSSPGWQAASIPYSSTRILPRYRKQECWWDWYRLIIYKHTHRRIKHQYVRLRTSASYLSFIWISCEKGIHMNFIWNFLTSISHENICVGKIP